MAAGGAVVASLNAVLTRSSFNTVYRRTQYQSPS